MVRRGIAHSRGHAHELIESGRITVSGSPVSKAARLVDPAEPVELRGDPPKFVSRAGGKLEHALVEFGVDVTGRRGLDVGSSTGGFTDCLLQHGVEHVLAVDVGTHQLHERLRDDDRVTSLEQTDIRRLDPSAAGAPFGVVTADVSFISVRLVLDALLAMSDDNTDMLVLIKPQFEAGKVEADRSRGVISDPTVWRRVLSEVSDAISERGAVIMNIMVSAVPGARGNIEFVAHVRRGAPSNGVTAERLDAVVVEAQSVGGA